MALLLMIYQVLIIQYYYMDSHLEVALFFIISAWLTVLRQLNLHLINIVLSRLTYITVSVS